MIKTMAPSRKNSSSSRQTWLFFIILLPLFAVPFFGCPHFSAEAAVIGINGTKHDLSVNGPGPIKSATETRICVFCHTPHNAYRSSSSTGSGPVAPPDYTYLPLWNHKVSDQPVTTYSNSNTGFTAPQPTGPTKLCLSCHDGTVALGAVASGANLGITGTLADYPPNPGDPNTNLGTDLSTHHPVSFPYASSLPNPELASVDSLPSPVLLSGDSEVHCSTCHNPHDDTFGNFLVMDNSSSQLCKACHLLTGWDVSAHDNCEVCHTPHFAVPPGEWLLKFSVYDACLAAGCHSSDPVHTVMTDIKSQTAKTSADESPDARGLSQKVRLANLRTDASEATCAQVCHSSEQVNTQTIATSSHSMPTALSISPKTGARIDIKTQVQKFSAHRASQSSRIVSQKMQMSRRYERNDDVTCMGCHNPHRMNSRKASPPYASGLLDGVSGVDRNGVEVDSVTYEYEVCFKCHADYSSPDFNSVPRVVVASNKRLAFDPVNPSYHPVVSTGRSFNLPSIPSSLNPSLQASSIISCTDCHRDDAGGSRGPHGSSYPTILGERYETGDNTPENYQNYALCYRCHERRSILNDESFRKKIGSSLRGGGGHSGHLEIGATCSTCHDPHGVVDDGMSGSHTSLINFDTRTVKPKPGNQYPIFNDTGNFSGSCTLICHGKLHDNLSY